MKIKVKKAKPEPKQQPPKKNPKGFQKGHKKIPGSGAVKGQKYKFTTLKQAFLDAFEGMGGTAELQRWGTQKRNRATFYNMICKMLPKEMTIGAPTDSPESLPFKIVIEQEKK